MSETFVGVISDTHGLLRPEALAALRGCDLILHAGDVGGPDILPALRRIAPVVAVRGNVDDGEWAAPLAPTEMVETGGAVLYLLHDRYEVGFSPSAAGVAAVIYGHSHRPSLERRDGVLWLNPGSAGPRRFSNPITVAHLRIAGGRIVSAELKELETSRPPAPRPSRRRPSS